MLADSNPQKIGPGNKVTIDYKMSVEGRIIENCTQEEFIYGENKLLKGIEKELLGLQVNQTKTFLVEPEDAFGSQNEKLFMEFPLSSLPKDLEPKLNQVIEFKGPDGRKAPGYIHEIRGHVVIINFNHPLAGKTIEFDVTILDIA